MSRAMLATTIPALYLIALGGVAYTLFYHMLFSSISKATPSAVLNWLLFLLPVLSGIAITAWFLRPFIPLTELKHRKIPLSADHGTEISELVKEICVRLDIKTPVEITLSLNPLVAVQPTFSKKRLLLTLELGLPLVSSVNTQQLTALISHELGHYKNGVYGTVFTLIIRIDHWIHHCLSGNDGWRHWFDEIEKSNANSLAVSLALVGKAGIWLSDRVLAILHRTERLISKPVMQILERDADQTAVLLCGSTISMEALLLQDSVSIAWHKALTALESKNTGTLFNDFPAQISKLVSAGTTRVSSRQIRQIHPNHRFHAATAGRVAYAKDEETKSLIDLDFSAKELFRDFQNVCLALTPLFYRELGIDFSSNQLASVVANEKQHELEKTLFRYLDSYTASSFFEDFIWNVDSAAKIAKFGREEQRNMVQAAINQFREHLPDFQDALIHRAKYINNGVEETVLELKLKHGYIDNTDLEHQLKLLRPVNEKAEKIGNAMTTWSQSGGLRISGSIFLTEDKRVLANALQLLSHLQLLSKVQPDVHTGTVSQKLLVAIQALLVEHADAKFQEDVQSCCNQLAEHNRKISEALKKLPGSLKGVPNLEILIHETVANRKSSNMDPVMAVYAEFDVLREMFRELNKIVSGKLAAIAMFNEKQYKIEPVRLIPSIKHSNVA